MASLTRSVATALAALAAGVTLSGQVSAARTSRGGAEQAGQPVFRSGVELVTVDVVATTSGGDPVHNLKAADFELFEDGVRQEIRTFEFINFSVPRPQPVLPPDVFTNAVEPGGIFVVVLDEIGYQADDVGVVRRVAERFFNESLQPNDHVAVVRSGANSGFFLTSDRTLAVDAIAASSGRRERTFGITAPGVDAEVQESTPSIETFGSGENGRNSFRVLAGVVDQLRQIRARRKAILWFSRGADLPPNILESFELQRPVGRDDDAFSRLIQAARAANVAIYGLDPRGLQSPGADLGRDIMPMDTSTLHDIAGFTGGRTVLGNDPNAMLEKIAAENRAYYLLGYEPATSTAKRQRPRKLRVTTRAPGVSLLHRSVFLPGSENNKGAAPALIASPLPVRDLAVMLAPAPVAIDRRKRGLLVPFEIGGDLRDGTDVEYTAMALDPSGKVVSRAAGRGKARNGRVVGEVGLAVESKAYQVRLSAHAENPELNGLAFATVRVPEGESKEPVCGNFVFEQAGPREGLRSFSRTEPMTISTLVSAERITGALSFGLGPAGGIPQRVFPVTLGAPLAKGLWRVALKFNALPLGNLELQLLHDGLLLHDNCVTRFSAR